MKRLIVVALAILMGGTAASADEVMNFTAVPKEKWLVPILGSAWTIYASGTIDEHAGERLDAILTAKEIPYGSFIYFSSPGGNVAGGLSLGRVVRKHGLLTYIGVEPSAPNDIAQPGICMSSCSLAFLGGQFRYIPKGSLYGMHRFSGPPSPHEGAVAQLVSAGITA